MSTPTVRLPTLSSPVDELWHALFDLADTVAVPWTLVGGQMVLLHALEHGQVPSQVSQDADVIVDIRAAPTAIRDVVAGLEGAGFTLDRIGPDGVAHRYVRATRSTGSTRAVAVDVLAPEGLGRRADLTTTKPGHTLQVPGGTQALERTERVVVVHEGRRAKVPRPTLLAAIVGKAAACGLPGDPARHFRDLALLCALAADPFAERDGLTPKDHQRLKLGGPLADAQHPAWLLVPTAIRRNGQISYAVLAEGSE